MATALTVCSCDADKHAWIETYYGWKCSICSDFVPFGCEPWAYISNDDESAGARGVDSGSVT